MAAQETVELQNMAQRPSAKIRVLSTPSALSPQQAVVVAVRGVSLRVDLSQAIYTCTLHYDSMKCISIVSGLPTPTHDSAMCRGSGFTVVFQGDFRAIRARALMTPFHIAPTGTTAQRDAAQHTIGVAATRYGKRYPPPW